MIATIDDQVTLLVSANKSPHGFNLKPSHVKEIQDADIIFYIDNSLETFLEKPLLNSNNITQVTLVQKSKLRLLKIRSKDEWVSKKILSKDKVFDKHVWLDTKNVKEMLEVIKDELVKLNPVKAEIYQENFRHAINKIDILYEELRDRLAPLEGKFMVFHDAFHYFENQFNLQNLGAITVKPHHNISIKSLRKNMTKAKRKDVKCVFYEPQFNKKFANMVAKSSKTQVTQIDPLGFNLKPSADLYFILMRNMSKAFEKCLTRDSK
jgi:zinc transport system substrate-binding protein